MAVKKSYNRYFIIYQEEDKGYGIAIDKQPTGYTKIENRNGRCKITSYVQNLVGEKGPYTCCLIDTSKDPVVFAKLGQINIDDTGRGETWWEYREDDIADTGVPFDRFNVAAIITDDGQVVYAPLAGYIGKERIPWKSRIPVSPRESNKEDIENKENIENEENVPEEEEMNDEAKKFKEYEENVKKNSQEGSGKDSENKEGKSSNADKAGEKSKDGEPKKEENKDGNKAAKDGDTKKEENKDGNKAAKGGDPRKEDNKDGNKAAKDGENKKDGGNKKDGENKKDDGSNQKSGGNNAKDGEIFPGSTALPDDIGGEGVPGYIDSSIYQDMQREDGGKGRTFSGMFHDILDNFEEVKGLSNEAEKTRWWKIPAEDEIPISENMYFPYFSAIYHLKMTYPYINYVKYFRDPGYYYFGIKYNDAGEVKYLMYGIEGKNTSQTQPYMGMTGFIKWARFRDQDTGMWIMYYNPYTGAIMIPKRK